MPRHCSRAAQAAGYPVRFRYPGENSVEQQDAIALIPAARRPTECRGFEHRSSIRHTLDCHKNAGIECLTMETKLLLHL
jgi:hypothetical protein